MLKNTIEQAVKSALDKHINSDTVSKDELADILTDVLYSVLTSTDFIDSIDANSAKIEKMRSRGLTV